MPGIAVSDLKFSGGMTPVILDRVIERLKQEYDYHCTLEGIGNGSKLEIISFDYESDEQQVRELMYERFKQLCNEEMRKAGVLFTSVYEHGSGNSGCAGSASVIIFLLLLIASLIGCGPQEVSQDTTTNSYKATHDTAFHIYKITKSHDYKGYAYYDLRTIHNGYQYKLLDTIGKYNLSDTLYFTKHVGQAVNTRIIEKNSTDISRDIVKFKQNDATDTIREQIREQLLRDSQQETARGSNW